MKATIIAAAMLVVGSSIPLAGQRPATEAGDNQAIVQAAVHSVIQHYPNSSLILESSEDRAASTAMAANLGLEVRAVVCGEGGQPACDIPRGAVAIKPDSPSVRGDSAEISIGVTMPSEDPKSEMPHLQMWVVELVKTGAAWRVEKSRVVLET